MKSHFAKKIQINKNYPYKVLVILSYHPKASLASLILSPIKPFSELSELPKETISKEKPAGVKGNLIKSAFITSTMGISYKLKLKG